MHNRQRDFVSAILALGVHVLVAAMLFLGLPFESRPEKPIVIMQGVFLDTSRAQLAEEQRIERERRQAAERQRRAEDARKKAEAEAEREAQEEARRRAAAEAAREQAEAEARQQAEAEARRRAQEAARKKAEAEAQRKAEAAARKAAEERRAAERQKQFQEALASEEQNLQRARDADDRSRYISAIAQHVRRHWSRPAGALDAFSCRVRIEQLRGGQIASVKLLDSCGNSFLDASVEHAVRKSDPLPLPSNERVFERIVIFNFEP